MNGRKPNKEEQDWLTSVIQIGCIVCKNEHTVYSPAVVHHMKGCKKPDCHLFTIPLCPAHHAGGHNSDLCISRHTSKYQFEQAYGTEESLLEQCQAIISGVED